MKLGELHCTYCLLEEKTNYVSQLESSISCMDTRRPSVSTLSSQTKGQSYVSNRSELESYSRQSKSDTNTLIQTLKKTDKIIKSLQHRKKLKNLRITSPTNYSIIESTVKLKPKNFSTTCNVDGDKMLEKDVIDDMTIMHLTDMILKTLAYKQKQNEFVKHASTLALFEANKCKAVDERVKTCALFYNSSRYNAQKDVIIQFLKDLQFDINRNIRRNATTANCTASR